MASGRSEDFVDVEAAEDDEAVDERDGGSDADGLTDGVHDAQRVGSGADAGETRAAAREVDELVADRERRLEGRVDDRERRTLGSVEREPEEPASIERDVRFDHEDAEGRDRDREGGAVERTFEHAFGSGGACEIVEDDGDALVAVVSRDHEGSVRGESNR